MRLTWRRRIRAETQFSVDLHWSLDMAHAILDEVTQSDIQHRDLLPRNVCEHVQVVAQGDDLGTQRGTWTAPQMHRDLIKPYHRRLCDLLRSKSDVSPDRIDMLDQAALGHRHQEALA